MTTTIGLKLEPLDVLFFRDGRPFGAATRGQSGLPQPQTLAGAVWTALLERHGCDFREFAAALKAGEHLATALRRARGPEWLADIRVRGPWLARGPAGTWQIGTPFDVLVPAPAALHGVKGKADDRSGVLQRLCPLRPDKLPGWQQTVSREHEGLWPLWLKHREPTEPVSGYLTTHGLRQFLANQDVRNADLVRHDDLFDFDHRTGIGIEPDRLSAQTGIIYGASFLALKRDLKQGQEVFLYAEVALPEGPSQAVLGSIDTLAFGGEGRRVRVARVEPFPWHEYERHPSANERPLLLLTTPGIFKARWRPDALDGRLLAAAVPGSVPVSGWDLARAGPKPTRFAAQAGSVYFLDEYPKNDRNSLPESLADDDQAQGWGCYLKGVWTEGS